MPLSPEASLLWEHIAAIIANAIQNTEFSLSAVSLLSCLMEAAQTVG